MPNRARFYFKLNFQYKLSFKSRLKGKCLRADKIHAIVAPHKLNTVLFL